MILSRQFESANLLLVNGIPGKGSCLLLDRQLPITCCMQFVIPFTTLLYNFLDSSEHF